MASKVVEQFKQKAQIDDKTGYEGIILQMNQSMQNLKVAEVIQTTARERS